MTAASSGAMGAHPKEICDESHGPGRLQRRPAFLDGHPSVLHRVLVTSALRPTVLRGNVVTMTDGWRQMLLGILAAPELIPRASFPSHGMSQSVVPVGESQTWEAPSRTFTKPSPRPTAPSVNVVRIELSPDEAYVDQKSGLLDRKLFIRLARKNAFPASRIGNRYLAKLCDVRRYIEGHRLHPTSAAEAECGPGADELDDIRRAVGLRPKGTR